MAWLPLGLYVLLKGLNATALKGLQAYGAANPIGGENPISFCNVFFVAQLIVGLAALLPGRRQLPALLRQLRGGDRRLLALDTLLGLLLGPVAFYFSLESLTVISQTLLFALVLPLSALLARRFLGEALPRGFWLSFGLIALGLLLPQLGMAGLGGPMDELRGVIWALLGVLAFAGAGVSGRAIAQRGWPISLTVGFTTTISALIFGALALVLFGPTHFHLLSARWVVGVIMVYGIGLSLGSELALRQAYRRWSVAQVSLWGSLTIVVSVVSAALLLGEPVLPATVLGLVLVLLGTRMGTIVGGA
ncbi:DMT family transporter [Synechococcus sp. CS-1329]|uniref:DMT family transporter n=1 Tax=Synechococcus sp. CS-1329 TaxID=2847975 RepID=UPI00223BEAC9|nr:DMT family transporter [Synechococcus sp. CS-1329]MCT0217422.1 DMT family transporter [Synechococcus sp. CS-1329]